MTPPLVCRIWKEALPYLDTRRNVVHTAISLALARRLMIDEVGRAAVVVPAVILHDVGWKSIPEALQPAAFGPGAVSLELNRRHEVEGARIAADILVRLGYAGALIGEIVEIVDGHDSRVPAVSREDMLVKDADRLWRFSRTGFTIDIERFRETREQGLERLETGLRGWLFTPTAVRLARENLQRRREETTR